MELLKKAEVLCERDRKGQATTFNNLAVYYRRQGKVGACRFLGAVCAAAYQY